MSSKQPVPEVQARIDALQVAHRDKMIDLERERDTKRNEIYSKRTAFLAEKGPKNFWSLVIRSHPDVQELVGAYDDCILDKITGFDVQYTDEGCKLTMTFAKNDYFEDTCLWAEENDDGLFFSGVQWKEGKGPTEDGDEPDATRKPGAKTPRAPDGCGPTLFEFFEEMDPHPEDDSEFADADDDELDDAIETWQEDQEDRKEFFAALVEEIWMRPIDVISGKLSKDDE
jgi:hypothetical protein